MSRGAFTRHGARGGGGGRALAFIIVLAVMGLTGCRPQPLDAVTRNAMLEAVGDDELVTQRKAMRGQFERKIAPDFRVLGEKALRFDAGADGPVFQGINMSLRDHRDPEICEDARDRLWSGVSQVLAYRINDRCRFAVLVYGPVVPLDHGEPQQLIVLYDVELIKPPASDAAAANAQPR